MPNIQCQGNQKITKIGPYKSIKEHPVNELYKNGLLITINCDDPSYLSSDINENFDECIDNFGWEKNDILKIINNSINASFMDKKEKKIFFDMIDEFLLKNS
jgi:adenosine deaminase